MQNKFENFVIEHVKRSEITPADYNPRLISEQSRKKLRKKLKEHGLVFPITVNKRTGNIVAGHQRIGILDELHKGEDYNITVAYIDVDEKKEKELNIFLNNQSAMGEWDRELLYDLKLENPELDFINDLGFDKMDLNFMFSGMEIEEELFQEAQDKKRVISDIEKIHNSDKLREYKKASREKFKENNENWESHYIQEHDYYVTFVFNTTTEKRDFLTKIGKNPQEKHLKAAVLFDILQPDYRF